MSSTLKIHFWKPIKTEDILSVYIYTVNNSFKCYIVLRGEDCKLHHLRLDIYLISAIQNNIVC